MMSKVLLTLSLTLLLGITALAADNSDYANEKRKRIKDQHLNRQKLQSQSNSNKLFQANNPRPHLTTLMADPNLASGIILSPDEHFFQNVPLGDTVVVQVEVINTGSDELVIHKIEPVRTRLLSFDWLSVSHNSLTIPAGEYPQNADTIEVTVITPIQAGSIAYLLGEVYFLSNAPSPNDSITFDLLVELFTPFRTITGGVISTAPPEAVSGITEFVTLKTWDNGGIGNEGERHGLGYDSSETECETSTTPYLYSGSPFLLKKTENNSVVMTHSQYYPSSAQPGEFIPVESSAPFLITVESNFEKAYSGLMIGGHGGIGLTQTFYAPTGGADSSNFMIQEIKLFSFDGNSHSNLAIGNILDWDIPAEVGVNNNAGYLLNQNALYLQGTDTSDAGCQLNANRFAASAFLGSMHGSPDEQSCIESHTPYGQYIDAQGDGPLWADYDEAEILWDSTRANNDLNVLDQNADLYSVTTYDHGFDLLPDDTLTFYTALVTIRDGSLEDLENSIETARIWTNETLWNNCDTSCCRGIVGNVDCDAEDIVDISDLTCFII